MHGRLTARELRAVVAYVQSVEATLRATQRAAASDSSAT